MTLMLRRGDMAPAANILSDNFTRANSALTAGSTNSYAGGASSQAWTPSAGSTWGISGNNLYGVVGTGNDYLTVPAGIAYADVRATIVALQSNNARVVGVVAGFVDTNNMVLLQANGQGGVACYKCVGGVFTQLGSILAFGTFQGGELGLRLRPGAGSNTLIDVFLNGVLNETLNVALGFALGTNVGIRQDVTGAISPSFLIRDFRVATAGYPVQGPPTLARAGVVLGPSGGDNEVLNPDVKFIDGQWVMNYSSDLGVSAGQLSSSLAYASSLFGPWTPDAGNPILTPGAGENGYATNGSIVKLGSTYFWYYQDGNANTRYATASAINGPYTKQGVVTGLSGYFDPFARIVGGNVELWLCSGAGARSIYYTTSADGVTFAAPTAAFAVPLNPSNGGSQGEASVYTDAKGGYHCFYCSAVFPGSTALSGRVIHEAVSPTGIGGPWIQRPCRLLLGGASAFDSEAVFDPSIVLSGNQLFLFYAGSQLPGYVTGLAASIGLAIGPDWST